MSVDAGDAYVPGTDNTAPPTINQDLTTVYNGTVPCTGCGSLVDPIMAMYAYPTRLCPSCRRRKAAQQVKGMFV